MKADADFLRDFSASHLPVMAVAMWLKSTGKDVKVNVPTLRADAAERFEHSDCGDIEITRKIEVKQRKLQFTGAHDYPYPAIFISEKYRLDKLLPHLWAIAVVNQAGTHAAFITAGTQSRWVLTEKHDEKQKRDCVFVSCPKELAKFVELKRV